MKFFIVILMAAASLWLYSCDGGNSVPGCQTTSNFCKNYTGSSHYQYPNTTQDLMDNCSGDFYGGGCPENTAYAVCKKADYNEDFNYEYVFYTSTLSADMVTFSADECTILNNN